MASESAEPVDPPLTDERDLLAIFSGAAKPQGPFLVGVEHEKIGVRPDGMPAPYEGGVRAVLDDLVAVGWRPTVEDGAIIALALGADRITLEPGAQTELSAAPVATAVEAARQLDGHVAMIQRLAEAHGFCYIAGGFRPWGTRADVPWLPKRRYEVMRAYLPPRGAEALDMMLRTATLQVNFDFADEADAASRMKTACAVTSIVTAMMAASPIAEGRPCGRVSRRAAAWLRTDESRCGFPPGVFDDGFGFAAYAAWALDVPMFFVQRQGRYLPAGGLTFRRFMREGLNGERAAPSDWELHLSTLFPEVRLKRTIEMRGADAAPLPFARALTALWRGLLETPDARRAAWALTAGAPLSEREALRRDVPTAGLRAQLGGRPLAELARQLVAIADGGLAQLPGGDGDRALLDPLRASTAAGRCPADDMLDDFHAVGGDPRALVTRWRL